jgi:hypothetical protein
MTGRAPGRSVRETEAEGGDLAVNVLLAIVAVVVALPLLLLVGFFVGPPVLVVLFVLICAVPAFLVAGAVERHRR